MTPYEDKGPLDARVYGFVRRGDLNFGVIAFANQCYSGDMGRLSA